MGMYRFSPNDFTPVETLDTYRLANRLLRRSFYEIDLPSGDGQTSVSIKYQNVPLNDSALLMGTECVLKFSQGYIDSDEIEIGYFTPGKRSFIGAFGMWPERPPYGFVTKKETFEAVPSKVGSLLLTDVMAAVSAIQ